jgi:Mg2+ and Co2+ transporter CorA
MSEFSDDDNIKIEIDETDHKIEKKELIIEPVMYQEIDYSKNEDFNFGNIEEFNFSKKDLNDDDNEVNILMNDFIKIVKNEHIYVNPRMDIEEIRELQDEDEKLITVIGMNFTNITLKTIKDLIDSLKNNKSNILDEKTPIWIDFQNMDEDDYKDIQNLFRIHPLTIEDCIHDTVEKYEAFPKYIYISLQEMIDPSTDEKNQINIILLKNYILTLHSKKLKTIEIVLKRIENEFEFDAKKIFNSLMTKSKESYEENKGSEKNMTKFKKFYITKFPSSCWILYALIDGKQTTNEIAVVDLILPTIEVLISESDTLNEFVYKLDIEENEDMLLRLKEARKVTSNVRRMTMTKNKIATNLSSRESLLIKKDIKTYLRDVLDHLNICKFKNNVKSQ